MGGREGGIRFCFLVEVGRYGCQNDRLDEADTMVRVGGREGGREGRLNRQVLTFLLSCFPPLLRGAHCYCRQQRQEARPRFRSLEENKRRRKRTFLELSLGARPTGVAHRVQCHG